MLQAVRKQTILMLVAGAMLVAGPVCGMAGAAVATGGLQPPAEKPAERNAEKGERPARVGAGAQQGTVTKQRLRGRLELARAVVRKLEEAQRLADSGADAAEVEKAFAEAGRMGRFVGDGERGSGGPQGAGSGGAGQAGGNAGKQVDKGGRGGEKIFDLPGVAGLEDGGLGAGRALSAEEIASVREMFERAAPEQFAKLGEHSRGREQQMNRVLGIVAPRVRALGDAQDKKDGSVELRREELGNTLELIHRSREILDLGKNATPEQREAAGKRLRETLGKQFDVRLRLQGKQIDLLFERAGKMRADLNRLAEQRDKFVGDKAASMLRGAGRAGNPAGSRKPE